MQLLEERKNGLVLCLEHKWTPHFPCYQNQASSSASISSRLHFPTRFISPNFYLSSKYKQKSVCLLLVRGRSFEKKEERKKEK